MMPFMVLFTLLLLTILTIPARAQDNSSSTVTADQVNAIAHKMYCPVCENIPLDVCPTAACAQWRAEIRSELEAGKSEDQIISEFVTRYGDRVVGTPQDPMLRSLSLVTPWLIGGVVVLGAGIVLVRWWRVRAPTNPELSPGGEMLISDDNYRTRLERDIQARR